MTNVQTTRRIDAASGRLSPAWRILAAFMRSLPTDVRRIDMLWHSLYRRIGGGGYAPDPVTDGRWPAGLQDPIRGRDHGLSMRLNLQNWSDRRTYFSGRYYQPDISRLFIHLLRAGDQYVDIGANIGMTALLAGSRIGPSGRGLAFEPNFAAFSRLKEHLELNGVTNFELVPSAVADVETLARLYVPGDESQLGSLAPEAGTSQSSVEVRTVRADRYAASLDPAKPTLVKIDVEGYEMQVLNGARALLSWPEIMVVAEIADDMLRRAGHSREEVHSLMDSHGFVALGIEIHSRRWRKDWNLVALSGPLRVDKYDALFVRPNSRLYRERIVPALDSSSAPA